MIDAYEIGIQLALQDGVSAGLEVISRELAEVDRAVAATSAGIANLTHTAEAAVRAVAAAAGVRAPAVPSAPAGPAGGVTEAVSPAPKSPQEPPVTSSEVQIAASVAPQAPAAPRIDRPIARTSEVGEPPNSIALAATPQPVPPVPTTGPAAPVVSSQAAGAAAPLQAASPVPAPSAAPATTSGPLLRDSAPIREVVALQTPRAETVSPSAVARPLAPITASVAQAVAPRTIQVGVQPSSVRPSPERPVRDSPRQNGSAAPWSAIESRAPMPRALGLLERAAAPQPQPRETGDGGGGTVMLDGHLVGYWLAEQMARDASRPPGGTSFFDPRQSPAWTASGAV